MTEETSPESQEFEQIKNALLADDENRLKPKDRRYIYSIFERYFFIFYVVGQALIFVSLYVLTFIVFPYQPWLTLGSKELDFLVVLLGTIGFSLVIFVLWKRADRPILRRICFNLSISAAKKLEEGQLVEGSLLVKELLERIYQYSELGKYKIEIFIGKNKRKVTEEFFPSFEANLKELSAGYVEKLHKQRSAVAKAILESGVPSLSFANHLYLLAHSLFRSQKSNYDKGFKSLVFLAESSKKYFHEDIFLEKHKSVHMATKILAKVGEPLLVPIVGFILWWFFKYTHW